MKKSTFLRNLLLVLTSVLLLNTFLLLLVKHDFWGNRPLVVHLKSIEASNVDYNTFFIGSSLTRMHIVPSQFDEICSSLHTSSFNVGSAGGRYPETFQVYNKVKTFPNVSYVFIELSFEHDILSSRHLNTRNYYQSSLSTLYTLLINPQHSISNWIRLQSFYFAIQNILYRYSNIGILNTISNYNIRKHEINKEIKNQGFIFSDKIDKDFKQKIETGDTTEVYSIAVDFYNHKKNNSTLKLAQQRYLDQCIDLIKDGEQRNIQVIFLFQPFSSKNNLTFLYPIFKQIPNHHRIDMADPVENGKLYHIKYHFNEIHLNRAGSKEYTEILSKKFMEIASQK